MSDKSDPVSVVCPDGTTGLLEAKQILTGTAAELMLWQNAQALDLSLPLVDGVEIGVAPHGFELPLSDSLTVPCCLSASDVLAECHEQPGRDWNVYAVTSMDQLVTKRASQMTRSSVKPF